MTFESCRGVVESGMTLTEAQAQDVANAMKLMTATERLEIWVRLQKFTKNMFRVLPHITSILEKDHAAMIRLTPT